MFVLSLCNQLCPDKLPVVVGERLGDGSDGEVFTINDQPEKVIKLCVIYDSPARRVKDYHSRIKLILDYMVQNSPEPYAKLYEHGYLGQYRRAFYDSPKKDQPFVIYYYIVEKLEKLTEDEKKVFHTILSHEDRGITKNYTPEKLRETLQGLGRGLDFDAEKVTLFCDNIRKSPVSHLDLHPRNIMKTKGGEFKLIDFDRSILENQNV